MRIRSVLLAALLAWSWAFLSGCANESAAGLAKGPYALEQIFDGDSFNLRAANGHIVRIRLAGIDAPERGQPYSQQSKASLEAFLGSGELSLQAIKVDRFDRWIARVELNGQDAGEHQIRHGFAWFFVRYKNDLPSDTQTRYAQAEQDARAARRGLWAWEGKIEPPWKFREQERRRERQEAR